MSEPIDREQIRQDAERYRGVDGPTTAITRLASHCLALLTELEQAEKDLELSRSATSGAIENLENTYAARLAKTPALVEAAKWAQMNLEQVLDTRNPLPGFQSLSLCAVAHTTLTEAIAAWKQE